MIPTAVRIFVCTERQDMRRSFDALDPEGGALFVFASKRSNRLKVLWFDQNGYKRCRLAPCGSLLKRRLKRHAGWAS